MIADGRLERREGVTNVVVGDVRRLDGEAKDSASMPQATADLAAALPAANSFGRGRR